MSKCQNPTSLQMGMRRVVVGRTEGMRRWSTWFFYQDKAAITQEGANRSKLLSSFTTCAEWLSWGKSALWLLSFDHIDLSLADEAGWLSKLKTALHLNCLCSLKLNVRKYYGRRYQATTKERTMKIALWLLWWRSCDREPTLQSVPECSSFLYSFSHYTYLNIYYVQDTQNCPENINQIYGPLVKQSRRRQWHPTPVLLPGKSHGRRSLVGCSPWGLKESDTTERLHFHFSFLCIGEGNGNLLQCSCLENPRDGVAQSRTRLKWLSSRSSSGTVKGINHQRLLLQQKQLQRIMCA